MARGISLCFIVHVVVFILLTAVPHVCCKDCMIMRDKRDKIITFVNKTSCGTNNNPCSKFGGILELNEHQCICICPLSKPTYMESTNNCSAYKDVWSNCNLSFRRKLSSIPTFSTNFSTSLRLNIPKNFRKCKMIAERENSFYLSESGWSKLPQKYAFPFLVDTKIIRKRLKYIYVKWKTNVPSELVGKVFRLGITCGKRKDCVTLKISGKTLDKCILPVIPPLPATPTTSSFVHPDNTKPTNIDITTDQQTSPSSQPSMSNKNSRGSSSVKVSWTVIGSVIGVLIALFICIIVLAVCFWRRRTKSIKKKQNENASRQSSGATLNSSESQPEVTYASPHHPYQELKPPISGVPRGTYQSLQWNAKEDSSGYMLPSEPTTNNYPDPLYNEIGSLPRTLPPVYDYALPEDTLRFSSHLSNNDLRMNDITKYSTGNGHGYVGRASRDQEEPASPSLQNYNQGPGTSSLGAVSAPLNDDHTPPGYLDFTSEESANKTEPSGYSNDNKSLKSAPGYPKYKKPINVPKGAHNKGSPRERANQALVPPRTFIYEPSRLSRENLENTYSGDSTA